MDSLMSVDQILQQATVHELSQELQLWGCPITSIPVEQLLETHTYARMIATLYTLRERHFCQSCEAIWRCPTHQRPCPCHQELRYDPQVVPEAEKRVFFCSLACSTPIEVHTCTSCAKPFACRSPYSACRCLSNVEHGATAFCSSHCWNKHQTLLEKDQKQKRLRRPERKTNTLLHQCWGCKSAFFCERKHSLKKRCQCLKALVYAPEPGEWSDYNAAQKTRLFCSKACMGPPPPSAKSKHQKNKKSWAAVKARK